MTCSSESNFKKGKGKNDNFKLFVFSLGQTSFDPKTLSPSKLDISYADIQRDISQILISAKFFYPEAPILLTRIPKTTWL
jgi:hypothetical protein